MELFRIEFEVVIEAESQETAEDIANELRRGLMKHPTVETVNENTVYPERET